MSQGAAEGRWLVLGGTGQLGTALAESLRRAGRACHVPARGEIDLSDPGDVARALEASSARIVLNAAAFTDVGGAERPENRDAAFRLNRDVPAALARTCRTLGIALVHVSTDYVFDGTLRRPYLETDPPRPLQVYGLSKLQGENEVLSIHPAALVVRTSTLFGPAARSRPNYVDAILSQARAGKLVEVVELPVSSPTFAPDLSEAILALAERHASGIVHVVNRGGCSRLELARAVVEAAGLAESVQVRARPAPPAELARPAYSVLDTARLASIVGSPMRPWREGVAAQVEARRA